MITVAPVGATIKMLSWATVTVSVAVALPFVALGAVIDTVAPVAFDPEVVIDTV